MTRDRLSTHWEQRLTLEAACNECATKYIGSLYDLFYGEAVFAHRKTCLPSKGLKEKHHTENSLESSAFVSHIHLCALLLFLLCCHSWNK